MLEAPIIDKRNGVVTIVLTGDLAHRQTLLVQQRTTKIMGEGAWLRNLR